MAEADEIGAGPRPRHAALLRKRVHWIPALSKLRGVVSPRRDGGDASVAVDMSAADHQRGGPADKKAKKKHRPPPASTEAAASAASPPLPPPVVSEPLPPPPPPPREPKALLVGAKIVITERIRFQGTTADLVLPSDALDDVAAVRARPRLCPCLLSCPDSAPFLPSFGCVFFG